jgi:putative membrane protein
MSYLDDPRVFFAAERTMLAWQRTAVALIGLGFVIERFSLFMRLVGGGVPLSAGQVHTSLAFGVLFLVVGALVSTIAAVQFRRFIHELSHLEVPRGHGRSHGHDHGKKGSCDDRLATAFAPNRDAQVLLVKSFKAGEHEKGSLQAAQG